MFIQICCILFVGASCIQLLYWILILGKTAFYPHRSTTPVPTSEDIPVSIIICARNEAENLKKNLPRILNQNYRSFEVVVVNDQSTDETENILLEFNIEYPILRSVTIRDKPKGHLGKKHALTKGIHTAKHEVLLLTDADCTPSSTEWLRKMQNVISKTISVGLGYGPYEKRKGFLNKFIRFETVYTAVQYFSFAIIGLPYMGVGRNLIYKKSLFENAGGFSKHEHVTSGDDDLFVNQIANGNNTKVLFDPDTFVSSTPKTTWKSYYRQKARHYTTAKHYNRKHQLLLGLLSLSHFLHYIGGLVLLINSSTMFVSFFYTVRILVIVFYYRLILDRFQEKDLWFWIPVLDFTLILHFLIFSPSLTTGKTRPWK